jgi:hypothetical protein
MRVIDMGSERLLTVHLLYPYKDDYLNDGGVLENYAIVLLARD